MALIQNPGERLWRTDYRIGGRNIHALLSNDARRPSPDDPLIGSMETAELAEIVVDTHNQVFQKFGRHFRKVLGSDE